MRVNNKLFYIKYDADLNIISQYNADEILNVEYYFEVSNIFQQYMVEMNKNQKKLSTEIIFDKTVFFKKELAFDKLNLFQFLYFLNNFASKSLVSNLCSIEKLNIDTTKKTLYEVLKFYHGLSYEYFNIFSPNTVELENQKIYPFTYLRINNIVDFIVQISVTETKILLLRYRNKGKKSFLIIGGDFSDREYDSLIPYLINNEISDLNIEKIQLNSSIINLMGDTYFGERYTERRKKRGMEDALLKYGYSYSFTGISSFFRKNNFNIINFEAVFNTNKFSPLEGRKDFILGANSENTIAELKINNIDAVCLANNHALDFGEQSFIKTIEDFEKNDIMVMGGGINQYQANKILEVIYDGKKLAIFNGYWGKTNAYLDYEFYALHDRAGINILNGVIFNQIELYKQQNPDSLVLCFCHWGIDFKPVHTYQEYIAKKLIQSGADLIIGHGPHTLQKITQYKEKYIVYSIGNGVFNSNGEYDKHQALPYGFLTRLDLCHAQLSLYPIYVNNLRTFWKPRFVSEEEFIQLKDIYKENNFEIGQDETGFFFQIKI